MYCPSSPHLVFTGARVRPRGEQARAPMRAEGSQARQAHARVLQPVRPHHHRGRRPRTGPLSQAFAQPTEGMPAYHSSDYCCRSAVREHSPCCLSPVLIVIRLQLYPHTLPRSHG